MMTVVSKGRQMYQPVGVQQHAPPAAGGATRLSGVAPRTPCRLASCRNVLAAVMFAGAGFGYAQRAGLPVAIVRMQSEFSWDKQTQGSLLSAFYLGYFLLQLPGAALAHRYGARRTSSAKMQPTDHTSTAPP